MGKDENAVWPVPEFRLEVIWGNARILFSEVSGLETEVSKNGEPNKASMKRGEFIGDASSYEAWCAGISLKDNKQATVAIRLLNDNDEAMMSWTLINAYSIKITSAGFKSDNNHPLIELLEVAFETVQVG